MAGMCGASMSEGIKFTQIGINADLAEMAWDLVNAIACSSDQPDVISIHVKKGDDGKYKVSLRPYKKSDDNDEDVKATMSVAPFEDEGVNIESGDLLKAMMFMYFYQAVYTCTQEYELE